MIRINPDEITEGQAVPFDIYTVAGALMMSRNQVALLPEQTAILRAQGWRKPENDEETLQTQPLSSPAAAFSWMVKTGSDKDMELPDDGLRLPSRGKPPLAEAEVLIAEDIRLARRLLSHMLSEQGVKKVDFVENGRDAIHYFFHHRPHMVFLDIDMPNLSGLDVLRQIKLWSPDSFACIVSGHGTMANAREAKCYGVNGFLVKPINLVNLKRVLAVYERHRDGE